MERGADTGIGHRRTLARIHYSALPRAKLRRAAKASSPTLDAALAADLSAAPARDRRHVRAAADIMLGRRPVFTNECHGLHYPFLPADEYFERQHFPGWRSSRPPLLKSAASSGQSSPAQIPAWLLMSDSRPASLKTSGRLSIARSTGGAAPVARWRAHRGGMRARSKDRGARRNPAAVPHPRAGTGRVLFDPQGRQAHSPSHRRDERRAIVHLPLIVPDGCTFRVGGEIRPWVEAKRSCSTTQSSMRRTIRPIAIAPC